MKKKKGFIAVHREILSHPIMLDPKRFTMYMFLALNASWNKYETNVHGTPCVLDVGEYICSREMLERELGLTESAVNCALKSLKSSKLISTRVVAGVNIIKITNSTSYLSFFGPETTTSKEFIQHRENSLPLFPNENNDLQITSDSVENDVSSPDAHLINTSTINSTINKEQYIDVPLSEPIDVPVPQSPKSDLRRLGEFFCDKFKERFNQRYIFQYGKDNAILKRLLIAQGDAERVAKLIDMYFKDTDPFLARCGYTIGMLEKKANSYLVAMSDGQAYY